MEEKKVIIDIPSRTILKIVVIAVALIFAYTIGRILAGLFVAAVIAAALDPWVDWLQRHKIPRVVSAILFFVIIFGIVGLVIWLMIPPIVDQVQSLSEQLPAIYEGFSDDFNRLRILSEKYDFIETAQDSLASLGQQFTQGSFGLYGVLSDAFGGIVSFVTLIVLAFYLIAEEKGVKKFVMAVTPSKYQPFVSKMTNRVQEKMGAWLRGQLLVMLLVGVMTYIGLAIAGVEYALLIAVLAGLFQIIPIIGVIIAIIPALIMSFAQGPIYALFVVIVFIVVQQIDNHFITPKVMQKAVGINPVLVILALLIGAKLGGILGMVIAVPAATALVVIAKELFKRRDDANLKMGEAAVKSRGR